MLFEFHNVLCGVCGQDQPRPLGWRGGAAHHAGAGVRTQIVRCAVCSHLYPNPMPLPAQGLDELYVETEEYFKHHEVERKKAYGRELLQRCEQMLGRRGRYLDVGCGRGEFLWAAQAAGWEAVGCDPSSENLAWGREHLQVAGLHGTLEELRLPDASFDAVTLGGVIEHLYEPYQTLLEVARVLRPGGVLWLDAPNEDSLYSRAGNLYMRALRRDWVVNLAPTFPPYHVQGFNPHSLRRLLERAGFAVEQLEIWGEVVPLTGAASLRKHAEYYAARLVNWLGNRTGTGVYMNMWVRKPER